MKIFGFNLKDIFINVLKVFGVSLVFTLSLFLTNTVYSYGYLRGYSSGSQYILSLYKNKNSDTVSSSNSLSIEKPTSIPVPTKVPKKEENKAINLDSNLIRSVSWGGPQLWDAVNSKRESYGVNKLSLKEDLCTIASIRLNDLLELGKLDGHEGFSTLQEKRPDLKSIFDNYSTMAEFLAAGAQTPEETVTLWENSLGHRQLLTGGEYVWGCIYSQYSFSVAITAF